MKLSNEKNTDKPDRKIDKAPKTTTNSVPLTKPPIKSVDKATPNDY